MLRSAMAIVLTLAGVGAGLTLQVSAEQKGDAVKAEPKATKKRATVRRLPAYYAQLVDDRQRERIYRIQSDYGPRIEALETEIEALTAKRDAEIRAVLTPEQRQQLDAKIDEAKSARAAKAAKKNADKKADLAPNIRVGAAGRKAP